MNNEIAYISEALISESFGYTESIIDNDITKRKEHVIMMEGEFQRAKASNINKRIYSESMLGRETNKIAAMIKNRGGHPMGLDHPLPDPSKPKEYNIAKTKRLDMMNSCGLTVHLEMVNGIVYGKAKAIIGDSGTGDKLAAFVKAGYKPGVSSRAIGPQSAPSADGYIYVPESTDIICWDFVSNPSVHNSILNQIINEEIEYFNHIDKNTRKLYEVLKEIN